VFVVVTVNDRTGPVGFGTTAIRSTVPLCIEKPLFDELPTTGWLMLPVREKPPPVLVLATALIAGDEMVTAPVPRRRPDQQRLPGLTELAASYSRA